MKSFSRNVATSYLQLGLNVVYSLASVPLILHWLPTAEFGLWALLVQMMGYITLVDMGMNSAIARFLVDHKDQRGEGQYGALVKTSIYVSAIQGLIVLAIITLGSPLLADLAKIPADYRATFITLMRIQGVIAAVNFFTNPLAIMLNAHQRMDVVSRQGMITLMLSLGLLVLFLKRGCGIYAFVYANAIAAVVMPWHLLWHCRRLGFLPRAGEWGKATWQQFKEVFLYGKDIFLMGLGAQLITTSQTIIVSRTLGLETAAVWSVGTKIFTLVRQIQFQPYSAATAGLCEMLARNETGRLQFRFRNLVVLTASLGIFTGVIFALCNSLFITVWTNGKIAWSPLNDLLLTVWLFLTAIQCTHCNFVSVTKQIGGMRYLYFVEGCCFVALAAGLGYRWGIPGIIACSIGCTLLFSCVYGLWRSAKYFRVQVSALAVDWLMPSLKLALVLIPIGAILWSATYQLPPLWRLSAHAVVGAGEVILLLRIGLPLEVIRDAATKLPHRMARVLQLLAPCGA